MVVAPIDVMVVLLAGALAGMINVIVGSGTLISFPTLLMLGYPPVVANISNSIGLTAAGFTGILGYRAELQGSGQLVKRLLPWSVLGSFSGALLLLVLPPTIFATVVPFLIGASVLLVLLGPHLKSLSKNPGPAVPAPSEASAPVCFAAGITAVYGGYFGAAQGVLLLGILGVLLPLGIQRLNAIKNVLVTVVNMIASVTFVVMAPDQIDLPVAALIGCGALAGGLAGAKIGRALKPAVLRAVVVAVGIVAMVAMLL